MANARLLGRVDLLGLNAMGLPAGLHPLYGVIIGGSASTIAAGVARSRSRNADLIGLASGVAVGGVLYAMGEKYRSMGLGAIAGAVITSGMKWLEGVLFSASPSAAPAADKAVKGFGLPTMQALNGLGLPTMQALNGLGLPSIGPTPVPEGTIPGVAGIQVSGPGFSSPPVGLRSTRVGMSGPSISGLSAMYGATLLGAR